MGKWLLDMLAIVVGVVLAELILDWLRRQGQQSQAGEEGCF